MAPKPTTNDWRELVAVGCVAGDLTALGIARYAGVDLATAEAAIGSAREEGAFHDDGTVATKTTNAAANNLCTNATIIKIYRRRHHRQH